MERNAFASRTLTKKGLKSDDVAIVLMVRIVCESHPDEEGIEGAGIGEYFSLREGLRVAP